MKIKASGIKWDASEEEIEECGLPSEHVFDVDVESYDEEECAEIVSDMLSDEFGFCHLGFEINEE